MCNDSVNQSITIRSASRLIVIGLLCMLLGGCRGCRPWNPWAKKDKQEEQEKKERAFQLRPLRALPTDATTQGLRPVKAGHVTEFLWTVRANRENLRAEVELSLYDGRSSEALIVPQTRFELAFHRDVALPKGQDKQFRLWFPLPPPPASKQFAFQSRLTPRQRGKSMNLSRDLATVMPANQFFLVVLAAQPDRFSFLKQLYSLRQPPFELAQQEPEVYYQVILPAADKPFPVPNEALAWSPIAYIVWDEASPTKLSGPQQQALLAWLHWGGQLIISGPNSLALLKGSFLEPYLPATPLGTRTLGQQAFAAINEHWSIPSRSKKGRPEISIAENSPLAGVELKLAPGASFLADCDQLVAERSVGQGRVVVTAFPLEARPVINWRSYDSFFGACMLRKPPRRFDLIEFTQPVWTHLERKTNGWSRASLAADTTRVRFFARDTSNAAIVGQSLDQNPLFSDGTATGRATGRASWNDNSAVAGAAESALLQASGITVPKRDFVWKSLALYLLALVPINWGICRLVGRVEWAWVAAPIIAIVGAIWIVQEAQLDIGFARSRNEVAVLEMQGDYPRAHVSRYTALYSSLSTSFDVRLDAAGAVLQPFRGGSERNERIYPVALWSDKTTRLTGFQVDSNSTAMVHSEEFMDVGGPLALRAENGTSQIANQTRFKLRGAAVIKRADDGEIRGAWIGRLDPGTSKRLQFRPVSPVTPWFTQWDRLPASAKAPPPGTQTPSVRGLLTVSMRNLLLRRGESRLVGWVEEAPPGLTASPAISQTRGVTFVVSHLTAAVLPDPHRDLNLYEDVLDAARSDEGANTEKQP